MRDERAVRALMREWGVPYLDACAAVERCHERVDRLGSRLAHAQVWPEHVIDLTEPARNAPTAACPLDADTLREVSP